MQNHPYVELLGVKIDNITMFELNQSIGVLIEKKKKSIIANVNVNALNIAAKEQWFMNFLNSAEINFCDGDGVRLGAMLQGKHIYEKITYNRWITNFAEFSQEQNISWYLMGSKRGVVEVAKEKIKASYPELNILGHHHGYIQDEQIKNKVIEDINRCKPDVLILGMGMPFQEQFLFENFDKLNFNVALTGGAVFDYVSGKIQMTPDIFYRLKLEWFFRLIHNPRRLFKRYVIGNPIFLVRVLIDKYFK